MSSKNVEYEKYATWREIVSQPEVWRQWLSSAGAQGTVQRVIQNAASKKEFLFVGCGTSYYLAQAAAGTMTLLTGRPARALPASEVLLYPGRVTGVANLQAFVISRSGKTSEAVRAAHVLSKKLNCATAGITCNTDSQLQAECHETIVVSPADEQSTVMTRSFTSMLLTLQLVAAVVAGNTEFAADLMSMAAEFAALLPRFADKLEAFVTRHGFADYIFLGQGPFHGVAQEASLKVMEMSCSYSQFFHSLEFRHGPKAIVSEQTCLMHFLSRSGNGAEAEVLGEMKELGGVNIAVGMEDLAVVNRASDLVLTFPFRGNELALLAPFAVAGQLFGFFSGLKKGWNPDQPKNLTRVVMLD